MPSERPGAASSQLRARARVCVCARTRVCGFSAAIAPAGPRPGGQGCREPVLGGTTSLPSPVSVSGRRPCPGHARAAPLQALPLPETLSCRGPPHPRASALLATPRSTVSAAINRSRPLLRGDRRPLLLGTAWMPEGQVESRHSPQRGDDTPETHTSNYGPAPCLSLGTPGAAGFSRPGSPEPSTVPGLRAQVP